LRQGKFKDATKFYNDAKKGAQDDKRLDLMWPAQRGLAAVYGFQAAQEKDPKKGLRYESRRSRTTANHSAPSKRLRQGSLRADESRNTFLASIKDVFDEAAAANAALALLTNPTARRSPQRLNHSDYAAEAISHQ
jgi:hypothetical protein